jgi:hypothetical protein
MIVGPAQAPEALEKRGFKHDRDGNPYMPEVVSKPHADTTPAVVGGGTHLRTGS